MKTRLVERITTALGRRPVTPTPTVAPADGWRDVQSCILFFSFFRLQMVLDPAGIGMCAAKGATVALVDQRTTQTPCRILPDGKWEVVLEALVDPAAFPGELAVALVQGKVAWRIAVATLMAEAAAGQAKSLNGAFVAAMDAWQAAHGAARPKLLDLGGRARSGVQRSRDYPGCDVTVLDIVAEPGVDVVGDAHELSRYLPAEHFDFVLSVAVFEHLAMPWKVAVEMAKVLKHGGIAHVFTHQTIGMHDLPWDFFRFSDAAFTGLFNRATGFEILATQMSSFVHIVPMAWAERYRGAERGGGFEGSSVLVRKIGEPLVDWDVRVSDFTATSYPTR